MTFTPIMVHPDDICHRCGYSLDGLAADGVCPECGTRVQDSLQNLLRRAPVSYIRQITLGLRLLTLSVVLKVAGTGLVILLPMLFYDQLFWVFAVPLIIAFPMGWVGRAMFAGRDPSLPSKQARGWVRRSIRPTLCIYVLATSLCVLATIKSPEFLVYAPFLDGPVGILLITLWIVPGIWLDFATMTYASWIATRVPDKGFARRVKALCWVVTPMLVLSQIMILGAQLAATAVAMLVVAYVANRLRRRVVRATKMQTGERALEPAPAPVAAEGLAR